LVLSKVKQALMSKEPILLTS